jgi:hypothetical protein
MIKKGAFDTWHVMTDYCRSEDVREVKQWCFDNIALNDSSVSYHCRKYSFTYERFPNCTNFVFDREADALLFALRWA